MWMENTMTDLQNTKQLLGVTKQLYIDHYSEDDDATTITTTGKTFSTDHHSFDSPSISNDEDVFLFEESMKNSEDNRVSRYQNTYFMDGGNRFISLPMLGNTSTKAASHISRMFEDWLQNKLYHQSANESLLDRLPILEDSVELLTEDIINKLKSRQSVKGLIGLSRVLIKIRTGHVYTYHQLDQPLITADMEDFFQQFPLFVEIIIYTMPKDLDQSTDNIELLLTVENITINPSDPYHIKQEISLIA
ncbi:uncharacterized protein B0P05DRAFT_553661 [Gilbertella persicaria]|uniref:Uncharacterized protein n=1 Tax=Rhizopus stolonifer TaxID=4846 RepID=A0A367J367_RHIST|nr:uncharacterized protein B0P05DRAFT_553661 [Gilbertella persicaria]KAI8066274.1 hypothetical protein B0P05DRAFT_553661 [Gilbertella persicaria]RCH84171.1 hypothetical protein CU098_007763 [Rhizopus stolonifer]